MSVAAALMDAGIKLSSYGVGNKKSICPRCSHTRKKKKDPCLSITIAADHALVCCHNGGCGWEERLQDPDSRPQERPGGRKRRDRGDGPPKDPIPALSDARSAKAAPTCTPGSLPKGALEWFERRGINKETVERNKVTVRNDLVPPDQGRAVAAFCFPYYRAGELVNVKYRGKSDDGDKIFRQEKDAEKVFYGLDNLPDDYDDIIICEGEIDALSLNDDWNPGMYLSVPDGAPASKPLGKKIQPKIEDHDIKFSYLWNCRGAFSTRAKRVVLAVDGDAPGTCPRIRARKTNRPGEVLAGALAGVDQRRGNQRR